MPIVLAPPRRRRKRRPTHALAASYSARQVRNVRRHLNEQHGIVASGETEVYYRLHRRAHEREGTDFHWVRPILRERAA